jgi:hypothetical protein
MIQNLIAGVLEWIRQFAQAFGDVFRADVAWVFRLILAYCDQVPPLAATLGIVLLFGVSLIGRAVRDRLFFGEALNGRFAMGGLFTGVALTGLGPYLGLFH